MFKTKQILIALAFVFMLAFAISSPIHAGNLFNLTTFDFERSENSQGILLNFGLTIHGNLIIPDDLDSITVTNPSGTIVLDSNTDEVILNGDHFMIFARLGTNLPIFGIYTVTVMNNDDTSESLTVQTVQSDVSSETPVILAPIDSSSIIDKTPTISWEPFKSPECGSDEILGYRIEIFRDGREGSIQAWSADISGDITSVIYNFDDTADPGFKELIVGDYMLFFFAYENRDDGELIHRRTSIRYVDFTLDSLATIIIRLNQSKFTIGDTLIARAHVINGPYPVSVETKIWIELPDGGNLSFVIDPHYTFTLGANADFEVPIFTYTFGGEEPLGTYEIGGRLLNPISGVLIDVDSDPFVLSP